MQKLANDAPIQERVNTNFLLPADSAEISSVLHFILPIEMARAYVEGLHGAS